MDHLDPFGRRREETPHPRSISLGSLPSIICPSPSERVFVSAALHRPSMSFPPPNPNRQNSAPYTKSPSPLSGAGGGLAASPSPTPYPPGAPSFPSTPSFQSYSSYNGNYASVDLDADENAPLSANAAPLSGNPMSNQQQFYPSQSNPVPDFMRSDPYGRRPIAQRQTSQTSQASEAEWRQRAGAVKRGVTRKVKLTRGNFIAVSIRCASGRCRGRTTC